MAARALVPERDDWEEKQCGIVKGAQLEGAAWNRRSSRQLMFAM